VLDVLFDGVPPYMTPEERVRAAVEAAERQAEAARRASESRLQVAKISRFTHGPFAAKECGRCHDLSRSSGFRESTGGTPALGSGADLAEAGRLRLPVVELCTHCHASYSIDAPENAEMWLHGPVAGGWCVLCHQPHSSLYPNLLAQSPTARLCSACHLRETLIDTVEHLPVEPGSGYPPLPETDTGSRVQSDEHDFETVQVVEDCTSCHDPHRGRDRLLLRTPRESKQNAEDEAHRSEPRGPT
jgi:predicted CXXCH cytochrome family protein